jgi:hypothetical protein
VRIALKQKARTRKGGKKGVTILAPPHKHTRKQKIAQHEQNSDEQKKKQALASVTTTEKNKRKTHTGRQSRHVVLYLMMTFVKRWEKPAVRLQPNTCTTESIHVA